MREFYTLSKGSIFCGQAHFDMLGAVLERLIDDGRWRLIDVSVIDTKAPRQRQAVPA
ncbi:hypothetical protein [Bordetella petrii]|uniref:hypothetical protein n=1 Tax=Bordetella petrii TaxID=94624 RepID=UPI001E3D5EB5|nr:hypothetical protein [Bordetella petrii]